MSEAALNCANCGRRWGNEQRCEHCGCIYATAVRVDEASNTAEICEGCGEQGACAAFRQEQGHRKVC